MKLRKKLEHLARHNPELRSEVRALLRTAYDSQDMDWESAGTLSGRLLEQAQKVKAAVHQHNATTALVHLGELLGELKFLLADLGVSETGNLIGQVRVKVEQSKSPR